MIKVSVLSGQWAFPCDVVDLSPTGCRIRIPEHRSLDDVVRLHFPRLREAVIADVVWRDGRFAGLRFRPKLGPVQMLD